jgi:hypothetical protein
MHYTAISPHANSLVSENYISIQFTWDWTVFVRKEFLAILALLLGFLVGGEGLEAVLKQLLH